MTEARFTPPFSHEGVTETNPVKIKARIRGPSY